MRRLLLVTALSVVVLPATAHGAFPGANGRIAFTQAGASGFTFTISAIDPDGTDLLPLTTGAFSDRMPAWSPDGTRIAFASNRHDPNAGRCGGGQPACEHDIYVMNQDGSGIVRVTGSSAQDLDPAWSPDGYRIVFTSDRNATEDCGGGACGSDLYTVNADGSNVSRLTSRPGSEIDPAWSPDGTRIAEIYGCQFSILDAVTGDEVSSGGGSCSTSVDWSPDGASLATVETYYSSVEESDYYILRTTARVLLEVSGILDTPAWSPDGTRIAFFSAGGTIRIIPSGGGAQSEITSGDTGEPDWQPLPVNTPSTHIRPKSAQQFSVPLVPASKPCTNPNREHGPPLAFGSCSPPVPQSGTLTAGVGGTSPFYANSSGRVRLDAAPGAPGGADDSDVAVHVNLTSVWLQSGTRVDYDGELQARIGLRTTDKDGTVSSTIEDHTLAVNVPCTTTPDDTVGSTCAVVTTADAVSPGIVPERTRAVWELEQVRVFDGGPDGDPDTSGDNSLFMTQGVFVP